MIVDYIVIGQGLAGTAVALTLMKYGASVVVIDEHHHQNASLVATGLYHPMVFKQLVLSWFANEALCEAHTFYRENENLLGTQFYFPSEMLRIFGTAFEHEQWLKSCNAKEFIAHISNPVAQIPSQIKAPFGAAYVKQAGYVDVKKYVLAAAQYLKTKGALLQEKFKYDAVFFDDKKIHYKAIEAKGVIYCQGYKASSFEGWEHAFSVTRGDDLLVEIDNFPEIHINGGFYLVHRNANQYRLGSTYFRAPFDDTPEDGLKILIGKLQKITDANFRIIEHQRAIRPNTLDRRPLIGPLAGKEGQYVFNGLGSKGVLLSPFLATHFVQYLLENKPLLKDVLPSRYGI